MKDFKLQLNNPPGGVYFPGMTVTGTVIAVTDEPKDYRAIQVKITGGAHVHWSESTGTGENRRTRHYSSSEAYIDTFVRVWDKDASAGGGAFQPGSYQFPFSLQLVGSNLPASYNGTVGRIEYQLEARVVKDALLKRDTVCKAYITVANVVQIDRPDLLQPKSMEVRKTLCCLCCASGPIVITATVPRTGYCIQRDGIQLEVSVENGSSRDITRMVASIHKHVHYTAQGRHRYDDVVVTSITGDAIRAHNSTVWRPSPIAVPDTPATSVNCSILQVYYTLRVVGSVNWALSPTINIPLVLGNVPLPEDGVTSTAPQPLFQETTAPYAPFAPYPPAETGIPLQPYSRPPPPAYTAAPTSQLPLGFVDPIQKI